MSLRTSRGRAGDYERPATAAFESEDSLLKVGMCEVESVFRRLISCSRIDGHWGGLDVLVTITREVGNFTRADDAKFRVLGHLF